MTHFARKLTANYIFLLAGLLAASSACAARPYMPPPANPVLQGLQASSTTPAAPSTTPSSASRSPSTRNRVIAVASGMHGRSSPSVGGRGFRSDCSGFAQAAYHSIGIDLYSEGGAPGENGVVIIHRYVNRHGRLHTGTPTPGDLVFFDGTHGLPRSRLTHIGIVEKVERDGTVVFLHHMQGRVVRGRMNRGSPSTHRNPVTGQVINDFLRRGGSGQRLAGELFAGYGTVVR